MPIVPCPNCRESVEIESDWYGRRVVCPSCEQRFLAERPTDDRDDRPRRRRDPHDDDRPSRSRREYDRRPRSNRTLYVILGVFGALALVGLACGGWGIYQFMSPIQYDGPWVTQTTPDGSCSVTFPKMPKAEDLSNPLNGVRGTNYLLEERPPLDAAFAFGHLDYEENSDELFDEACRLMKDAAVKETGGRLTDEKTVTVAGYPTREAVVRAGGASGVLRFIRVTDHGPGLRVLVLFAGGRNVSDADRKKFFDSLTFTRRK